MISHKHKCIFIHIPKTAGMSIYNFFHPDTIFYQDVANYDILFGWCPKRKLHMQHATAKQLLENELVTKEQWETYFKFTFVRNPWDRAYSDYTWIQKFAGVKGSFKNYLKKKNEFEHIFTDDSNSSYLGDHLLPQTDFFDFEGIYRPNFIGRFENFQNDIHTVLKELKIERIFDVFTNKSNRKIDYSLFYTKSNKKLIDEYYKKDIFNLNYKFHDNKKGIDKLKNLF